MTSAPARRSKTYAPRLPPEERRAQLLDAVLKIIVEQGVHKVSMDTVAREVGVTRPVVYSVFSDSDDMLRASLDREQEAALAQVAPLMTALQASTDPAAALVEFLDGFLTEVQKAPDRWRAAFSLVDSTTPKFRRRVDKQRAAAIAALEDYLRHAAIPRGTDIEVTARVIFTFAWEAGRLVLSEPEVFSQQRMLTFARTIIGEQFAAPEAAE
ncbi:TetR/AcrR family transcriptional regulator [Nocardia sp. NPDC003482]